MFMRLKNT